MLSIAVLEWGGFFSDWITPNTSYYSIEYFTFSYAQYKNRMDPSFCENFLDMFSLSLIYASVKDSGGKRNRGIQKHILLSHNVLFIKIHKKNHFTVKCAQ